MNTSLPITLLAAAIALAGCTTSPHGHGGGGGGESGGQHAVSPHLITPHAAFTTTKVYRGDGTLSDWDAVKKAALAAEVVVIAEQHGHPRGGSAAAALWRSTLEKSTPPLSPALALEFFERDEQSRLDDYLTGLSTEEVFLKRTGRTLMPGTNPWESSYPPSHRDMVEAAKAATPPAPVTAANAPRLYVRKARTDGYAALQKLTPEQQRMFVLPRFVDSAPPDTRYWRDFLTMMDSDTEKYAAAEAKDRARFDGMFRAQSVWDATMADSVRIALADGHAPVFLVVGQFHADFANDGGGGTVQAIKAARPTTRTLVISFQEAEPDSAFREKDKGRAEFVIYCGPSPFDHEDQPAKH